MRVDPPNLKLTGLKAFFTTKYFARSGEDMYKALARGLNISEESIYLPVQKHTDSVHVIKSCSSRVVADAVITSKRKILIGVIVADCVPVLLYDGNSQVIAAVHAGWKGTAGGILKRTIDKMMTEYSCVNKNIKVAIGPSIRGCSYEVGEDVMWKVQKGTGPGRYYFKEDSKFTIDLSDANKVQALSLGIPKGNIWQSTDCTFCKPDTYYSYRYSDGVTGRQGGFIAMW